MCGRYSITTAPEAMRRLFAYREQPNFPPRYNVAPTQPIPVVRLWENERRFVLMRWGLLPGWVKDPKAFALIVNARGESVNEKPAFRNAMKYRRCLIPADGFYEWRDEPGGKRPFFIRRKDGAPFAFAGLWESWSGPNGEELETACLVTTLANETLKPVHHRMPVILEPDQHNAWLDCRGIDAEQASAMIAPSREDLLEAIEVSSAVNRVANDSPDVQVPAVPDQPFPEKESKARKAKAKSDAAKPADDKQGMLF